MDEKAILCHAFTYFSSLADILSHLSSTCYLEKCGEKTNFETEKKKQSASFRLHFSL